MKKIIMTLALIAAVICLTSCGDVVTADTSFADGTRATFSGSEFGVGFAGEESGTMHKADGWSNGGMFNCTWRAANIWFGGYLNIKIDRDSNGGYSGGEYRTNDADPPIDPDEIVNDAQG